MVYLIRERPTSRTDASDSPVETDSSLFWPMETGAVKIHESGAKWTDPELQPIKDRRELVDTRSWATYMARIDRMETLGGTVYQIQGDRALIEFIKAGESILRAIDVSELNKIGASEVRVGDKVALISTHSDNNVQSQLRYLGSGLHRLNSEDADKLDTLRRDARKRGR